MNKISLIILLPIGALLAGVVYATFVHEYDNSRNLFQDRNLTIEDISGIGGNIISLQKDASGNITWIVSGKWQLDVKPGGSKGMTDNIVDFTSNLTLKNVNGISTNKISLSNFTLIKSHIVEEVATLDGTMSLIKAGIASTGVEKNIKIPVHIVISNARTIRISSDSDLFRKYFETSALYGNVPQRDRI
jgi:predicted transcriptional regulator